MKTRIATALVAGALLAPMATAHLEGGHVWVVDTDNNLVWEIDASDYTVTQRLTAAEGLNSPASIGFTFHGHLLISNMGDDTVVEYDGAYNATTLATSLDGINNVVGSPALSSGHGDVFLTNSGTNEIMHFDEDVKGGTVFADATDGIASPVLQTLNDGHIMAANRDGSGNIYLFDHDTEVGTLWDTIAGERFVGAARRNNGDIYLLTINGVVYRYVGGEVGSRVTLGTYGSSGQGGIAMNKFHQRLFLVNSADGTFLDIDADTGAVIQTVNLPGNPTGLAVGGNQYAPGTFIHNDDSGHPGLGGVSPHMHNMGGWEPRVGASGGLHIHGFAPDIPIFLFMSFGSATSTIYGFEFFIDTSAFWTFISFNADSTTPTIPGTGQKMLPVTLPNDLSLIGTQWQLQALGLDPGASQGVSSSITLNMYIGE